MGVFVVLLLAAFSQIGCAKGKFGKTDGNFYNLSKPSDLHGQNKSAVMEKLGDPDFVLDEGKTDYWGYRNHNGWYFYAVYVSFGMTEAKDLIVEFQNNKVKTAYLIHKGSSIGVFVPPLSVAN
jgi:outer membrane protein assembly factor BamE (lipoprotein component of BamABCDE complex)